MFKEQEQQPELKTEEPEPVALTEQQVFDIVTPSGRLMRNMTVRELKEELK